MLQRLWSSNKPRPDGAGDAPQGGAAAPLGGGAAVAAAAAASQQRDPTEQMRELQRLVEKLKGYHDLARVGAALAERFLPLVRRRESRTRFCCFGQAVFAWPAVHLHTLS